jgi:hypothetical protein
VPRPTGGLFNQQAVRDLPFPCQFRATYLEWAKKRLPDWPSQEAVPQGRSPEGNIFSCLIARSSVDGPGEFIDLAPI